MEELLDQDLELNQGFSEPPFVGFVERAFASIIDVVVYLPVIAITYYNETEWHIQELPIIAQIFVILYKPVMEANFGATVGKMILGFKVVNNHFENINAKEAIARNSPWLINSALSFITIIAAYSASGNTDSLYAAQDGMIIINTLSIIVSVFGLAAVITVIFNKKSQGLHDMIAGTYVVPKNFNNHGNFIT